MAEQQAHPQSTARRVVLAGALGAWLFLLPGCAPDAPPIERASGGAAPADGDSAGEPSPTAAHSASDGTAPSAVALDASRPPDVLLVSLDTLRADALSCYGNPRPTSPNIDALAAVGVRFARCHAPAPHTAPSHVSIFSGLLPFAHGVRNASDKTTHFEALHPNWSTLGEELARAGYQTMFVSNGGQLRRDMGLERGIEQFDSSSRTFAGSIATVGKMLDDAARDQPLFAFVHTYEPHAPYLPPARRFEKQFHGRFTDPDHRGTLARRWNKLIGRADEGAALASEFLAGSESFGKNDIEYLVGLYHENVLWTDEQLSRLLARWARDRDIANTLIVIVSDHGEQLGERGRFGHLSGLDPELTHVPFIAVGPGIEPRVEDDVVSLAGVGAAILEHLSLPVPEHFTRSARLASSATERSGVAHLQDQSGAGARGVVAGDVLYRTEGVGSRAIERLHDLVRDPQARESGAADPAALEPLRALVEARTRADVEMQTRFPKVLTLPPTRGQTDMLRDLGYSEEAAAEETPAVETQDGRGGDRK